MRNIDSPGLGFGAMLLSMLLFSLMDANVKWLGATYPTAEIMFFRCAVAIIPVGLIVVMRGGWRVLKTTQPGLHLLRSVLGVSAMGFAFYAFSLMPLADGISILHAAPVFMTALSVILLGDKVGIRRWSAVIVGFIGMLIVVRPGAGMLESGSFYMLIAAMLIACTTIIIRHLVATDDPVCITFYFTLSGIAISLLGVALQGWQTPPMRDLALLSLVGLLGGTAQYLMTVSYRYVTIGAVAPLKYFSILFGGFIAYMVWGEIPDLQSIIGIAIIIGSGLYTLHRELIVGARASR